MKLNDQSDNTADIGREEMDAAESRPELGETGQNIAPAEEIATEPDIELDTTPPVYVQQQEATRATTGFEQRYPTRSHQPLERWGLNCCLEKCLEKCLLLNIIVSNIARTRTIVNL